MKRSNFVLIIIMLVIGLSQHSFGQLGFRKGIKAGYNFASISGDDMGATENLKGLTGGIAIEFSFLALLSFEADVLYSPRGVSLKDNGDIELKYISIPMVLKRKFFPVGVHPYIFGGPEFNFLLSAKADGTDIKDELTSEDLAFVIGGGIEFSLFGNSAYAEGRYSYGLNNLYKDRDLGEWKNRVGQIFFGILF